MEISHKELLDFISCFKQYSNYDLSEYSENSLMRRLDKVLTDNAITFDVLLHKISTDAKFCNLVMKQITVNTTELFRDKLMWQELQYKLLPEFEKKSSITIWHAGCSNGLEVYSLAILLHHMNLLDRCRIIATDINPDIIQQAIKGEYSLRLLDEFQIAFDNAIKENPYDSEFKNLHFDTYFEVNRKKEVIAIRQNIKNKPDFSVLDLVKLDDSFPMKFDIVLCRNVLIYFNNSLQKRVFEYFYNHMNSDAYLILGMQESMAWFMNSMFEKKGLFYKKCKE
ncbi:MAG TPA: CheR family methyltransferase [Bacteroidales bacterium]|nr:CheR family methyltransferase [Bacteroidales bacterium]